MKIRMLVFSLAASVALVSATAATAATVTGHGEAVRACTALRTTLGAQTFALSFGTKSSSSAFGRCVTRFTPTANAAIASARSACAGKTGKAFAACVQVRADARMSALISSFKNAAMTCKSQLQSLGTATFAARYDKVNHNLANAYGKCVSSHASSR